MTNLWLFVAAVFNGVGQAGLFPASTNTFAKWIPERERALVGGSLASFMTPGTIIGTGVGAYLTARWGWQWMFAIFSLPGLIWAGGFWWWFRDRPEEHPAVNAAEAELIKGDDSKENTDVGEKRSWIDVLPSTTRWIAASNFPAAGQVFFMTWFPTFLMERYNMDLVEAGLSTVVTQIPLLAGSLIGGGIVDYIFRRTGSRTASRKGVSIVSMLLCPALVAGAYYVNDSKIAVTLIGISAFFIGTAGPAGYTITIDMGGKHVATLFSTMNMFGNLGALLFPIVVGAIIKVTGNWDQVLVLFGALYLASAFCWWRLRPDGTVFDQIPDADAR